MGRFLTRDYACPSCGKFDLLHQLADGEMPPTEAVCPDCGAAAPYCPSYGSNMKVALPDGTKRFADIKAGRVLEKAAKEAKRKGDKAEVKKITIEKHKLLRS